MSDKFYIIAHRGESFEAPENTLASVKLAWERKADAVEIDIQLTKDKKIVVIHDPDSKRITGVNKKIRDTEYEELRKLDVGAFKDPKYNNERIPLLTDVFSTVPPAGKLFVEVKSNSYIIPFLVSEIRNSHFRNNQLVLMSFSFKIMKALKTSLPDNICYWLYSPLLFRRTMRYIRLNQIIKKINSANLDGINAERGDWISKAVVDMVKSASLDFFVWTVNDPDEARRYRILGLDGVASDRASWLKQKIIGVDAN